MKKALIFGIGGFVGAYLAKELQSHDYTVYGSDISEKSVEGVIFTKADLMNAQDVENLVTNVQPDVIVNLAAISSVGLSWSIPQTTMSVNVIGALNILEAARKQESKPRVLFVGSSEEYAESSEPISESTPLNANNPYGISKMAQERFAELYRERYGMKIFCVRPFNHTGIGQRDNFVLPSFCKEVAEISKSGTAGVIHVGNLTVKRDFSHVKDVVRAYRMILESEDCTKVYNVGSGKAYSLQELLEYIVSLSSQKIEIQVDPARIRPVDTPTICCDHSRITADLGWTPEYTIFDTIKELYLHNMQA